MMPGCPGLRNIDRSRSPEELSRLSSDSRAEEPQPSTRSRRKQMKKWLIVAVLVAFLAIVAATVGGTAVAQATTSEQDCVTIIDQEAYDEVIPAVTHQVKVIDVEAVAGFWANFSPNDTQA